MTETNTQSALEANIPLVDEAGNTVPVWHRSYLEGVPKVIDVNRYSSINHFFEESTAKYRDNVAFMSLNSSMTYGRLEEHVLAFSQWLRSVGVHKGDRVALMMPNLMQYPVALFATLRIGAVVVNVNPLYTSTELEHQLCDSGAKVLVVLENFASTAEKIISQTAVECVVLTQVGDLLGTGANLKGRFVNGYMRKIAKMVPAYKMEGSIRFSQALALGRKAPPSSEVLCTLEDIAFLQYTGGTTGRAKGAILTHGNIMANCLQAEAWLNGQWSETEVETIVTLLPLYHVYALVANCLIFLGLGGVNVLIANPRDTKRVMMILKRVQFTSIAAVNTLFQSFLDEPSFAECDFSKLKVTLSGGTALHQSVAERWKEVTGNSIVEAYGLTECSPIVSIPPVDLNVALPVYSGDVGLPVPGTDVRIRRDDGSWAGTNEPGELCIKGPQLMRGYWQQEDRPEGVFDAEGYFLTGDVATICNRGFIRIVDRVKDMILVSGFNVYPNEIENVLSMHPAIVESCVVGVPDGRTGERVKAIIYCESTPPTEAEIKEHVEQFLTRYKHPREIVFSTEPLPKSPAGKILRKELKPKPN